MNNELSKIGKAVQVNAEQVLFYENDIGSDAYFVLKGTLGVYLDTLDGCPTRLAEIQQGNIVGEMSVLDGSPRSATILAETPCTLLKLDYCSFYEFLEANHTVTLKILKSLSKRIRESNVNIRLLQETLIENNIQLPKKREKKTESIKANITENSITNNASRHRLPLVPQGYVKRDLMEPEKHKQFILDRNITCPICQHEFTTKFPSFTRLLDVKLDDKLRRRDNRFDLSWYNVIVCPSCNYAAPYSNFSGKFKSKGREEDRDKFLNCYQKFEGYSERRKIDEVISAHNLAVYSDEFYTGNKLFQGKLQHGLYTLYDEIGEQSLCISSAEAGIKSWKQTLEDETAMTTQDKQFVLTAIGEMYSYLGKNDEAKLHLEKAIELGRNTNKFLHEFSKNLLNSF